jgi:hypothetical protein
MKKIFLSILCCSISLLTMAQQYKMPCDNLRKNPMARRSMNSVVGSNDQVAVFEYNGGLRLAIALNGGTSGTPSMVYEDIPTSLGYLGYYKTLAVTCADLDGDKFEEIIIAYQAASNDVIISAYRVLGTGSSADVQLIDSAITSFVRSDVVSDYAVRAENGKIELHTVQLDPGNEQEQVVLSCYKDISSKVQHRVYAKTDVSPFTNVGTQTMDAPVALSIVGSNFYNVEPWDVAFDDFNLDRKHEMVYVQRNASNSMDSTHVQIYEMTYEAGTSSPVSFLSRDAIALNPSTYGNMVKPEIAIGDINGDQIPEIVLADLIGQHQVNAQGIATLNGNHAVQMLQVQVKREQVLGVWTEIPGLKLNPLTPTPGLLSGIFPPVNNLTLTGSSSANVEFNVMDYNHDHRDDLVFTGPSRTVVVKGRNAGLVPRCGVSLLNNQYPVAGWNTTLQFADSILTIPHTGVINNRKGFSCSSLTDISVDGNPELFKLESKLAPEGTQRLFLTMYQYNSPTDNAATSSYELAQSAGTSGFNCALASGDLSGDGYELGTPFTRRFDDVSQPTVVLCAPPVHYDCFPDGCISAAVDNLPIGSASYVSTQSSTRSVETSSNSAWSMETSVGGGFSAGIASVNASFNTSYGESFETIGMEEFSRTTVQETSISRDDMLCYTRTPYQVTEYPILKGGNVVSHAISLMALGQAQNQWAAVTGADGPKAFIPTHEPGNIFSYRSTDNPTALDDLIGTNPLVGSVDVNSLSPSLAFGTSVTWENVSQGSQSSSYNGSVGGSLSAEAFGATLEISGSYDWGGMKTSTTTLTNTIDVSYAWDGSNFNSAMQYNVASYNSFGNNGVMMLGWGTDITSMSNIPTYFVPYTEASDPAWNMPWRLREPFPGVGGCPDGQNCLWNDDMRYQTKSIWLTPYRESNPGGMVSGDIRNTYRIANPEPGDKVVVHARIFNMSLVESPPVPVSFYHGHPNLSLNGNGNAPLPDYVSGFTEIEIPAIEPKMFVDVEFTVQLPESLEAGFYERGPRLYAVIDPNNFITNEVHEENNIAWFSLGNAPTWGTVTDLTLDVNVCNDPAACNYTPGANVSNDDACVIEGTPCDDGDATTTGDEYGADCNCAGVLIQIPGCTTSTACNYNANANTNDGSCYSIGDTCDDGDTQTTNDVYNANCICEGTQIGNAVNELNGGFSVFPNPSEGAYAISVNDGTSIMELEVFDVSGMKIISITPFSSQATVDLSDYAKGFYVLKIRTATSSRTIRLERI